MRVDGRKLVARVTVEEDSVRAGVEVTNRSAETRVPPVYNALCSVELRV